MGVYPMLLDERCWFLAADFDGENWAADSIAFLQTCGRLNVPAALERSRSGNGGHVWIFFAEVVPATMARKLGAHVLTETMEARPELGFRSYDRFFPNQDTLPKGGFGNLIALPLQKAARERGNSLFVDETLAPHSDQWAFLNEMERLPMQRLEQLVRTAEGRGRVINVRIALPDEEADSQPWILPPSRRRDQLPQGAMPTKLELVLGDQIYVPKPDLPPSLRNALVRLAAFQNPEFYRAQAMRLSAHSFELVARRAKAIFVTGLSATVARKDGHHPIIFMQCGPVRHCVDARQQATERPFTHEVLVRPTGFMPGGEPDPNQRMEFQRLCDAVAQSDARNRMICEDVIQAVSTGRAPIVLTERTEHLQKLAELLRSEIPHVITLQGGMGKKALRAALDQLRVIPADEGRAVVATGRFVGEGFDDSRLDTLFLTMPVSWRGTIAQYVGRLHRLHEGKHVVRVYDYADLDVPMLARMFDRRCVGYEAVGYTILLPASALPGWPAEVPLPVDAHWKQDYAASVRRLIRDGVDHPLAQLFVHVARPLSSDAEGVGRARSASEAFFFQRLESLPATKGMFKLNAVLPIPFDDHSQMEVDFLCVNIRLVIEIDGLQHLSDLDSWRRDRRKDALLQSHGYFILRFLADDLGKRLDFVLDTLLQTLDRLRRGKAAE